MTTHDRPTSGQPQRPGFGPKPGAEEKSLKTEKLQIERKLFILSLRENPRGRFIRITEDVGGRRESIIVPTTGLDEFRRVLDGMASMAAEAPPPPPPAETATGTEAQA